MTSEKYARVGIPVEIHGHISYGDSTPRPFKTYTYTARYLETRAEPPRGSLIIDSEQVIHLPADADWPANSSAFPGYDNDDPQPKQDEFMFIGDKRIELHHAKPLSSASEKPSVWLIDDACDSSCLSTG